MLKLNHSNTDVWVPSFFPLPICFSLSAHFSILGFINLLGSCWEKELIKSKKVSLFLLLEIRVTQRLTRHVNLFIEKFWSLLNILGAHYSHNQLKLGSLVTESDFTKTFFCKYPSTFRKSSSPPFFYIYKCHSAYIRKSYITFHFLPKSVAFVSIVSTNVYWVFVILFIFPCEKQAINTRIPKGDYCFVRITIDKGYPTVEMS